MTVVQRVGRQLKGAPFDDRNAHRLDVAGGDGLVVVDVLERPFRRRHVAFDVGVVGVDLAQRRQPGHRGRRSGRRRSSAADRAAACRTSAPVPALGYLRVRQRDGERHELPAVEAGVDVREVHHGPQQQPRANDERDRERDFRGNQPAADAVAAGAGGRPRAAFLQRQRRRVGRQVQQRRETEDRTGGEADESVNARTPRSSATSADRGRLSG